MAKKKAVKEDGEGAAGPGEGAATVDNVVGNGPDYTYLGRDAKKRKLAPEEKEMLDMTQDLADGSTKILTYDSFRAKAITEGFTTPDKLALAINEHLGDFNRPAHDAVKDLPIVDGLLEIKSINKALSSIYKVGQIKKVINAVLS